MGILDISTMVREDGALFARPMKRENLVSYFKKTGDYGPFTIMLDLEELPRDRRYIQVTVDFNEHKTGKGDPIIRLSQMSNPTGLVPQAVLEGGPGSYPFEKWRKEEVEHYIIAARNNVEGRIIESPQGVAPPVRASGEDVDGREESGSQGGAPRGPGERDGDSPTGDGDADADAPV
jgi:hypothetical protein